MATYTEEKNNGTLFTQGLCEKLDEDFAEVRQVSDSDLYYAPDGVSYVDTRVIATDGKLTIFSYDYETHYFKVVEGTEMRIQTTLGSSGATAKRAYAFYQGTPSATGFISGADATGAAVVVDETVVVPVGANYFAISVTVANTYSYVLRTKAFYADTRKLLEVAKDDNVINSELSLFYYSGENSGNTGILEDDAQKIFKGFWADFDEPIRIKTIDYFEGNDYQQITFSKLSDNSKIGTIRYDTTADKYSVYAIRTSTNSIYIGDIVGYVLMNPAYIKHGSVVDSLAYVTFNNSTSKFAEFNESKKTPNSINIFGDSLSSISPGYGGMLHVWEQNVNALGIGGEDSAQILARIGVASYQVLDAFTIPTTTTPVVLTVKTPITPTGKSMLANFGMNPCYIHGIEGAIDVDYGASEITFTRTVAGEALNVVEGEDLLFRSSEIPFVSENILILWMGQNDLGVIADTQVGYFKSVSRLCQNFLFLTPHINTSDELESKMAIEFGSRYINMRRWVLTTALDDCGITPTQADLDAIALGNPPPSLLSDPIHFNDTANEIIANYLIRGRLQQLKYI